MVEKKKELERKEIDQKVEEYKKSKKGVMGSVKGFFGFSNRKKELEEAKEVKKLQEDLDNEFLQKYEIEEDKLNKEIEEFIEKRGTFDPEVVEEMPGDWVRFKFTLSVPQTKFTLLKKDSTPKDIKKILEVTILGINAHVEIGRIFEDVLLSLKEGNIIDYISTNDPKGVYMFENVTNETGKNAIEMKFNHNVKADVPVKVVAITNAEFYIFLNIPCIKEVEMFFTSHLKHNKIDISYYAEQAKIQFLKYLNRSIDYVETIDTEKVKTMNVELNVALSSPVVFLEDPRVHVNRWMILNLGKITMDTDFKETSRNVDGKLTKYDTPIYSLGVVDFQMVTAEELDDPHEWSTANTTDIIDNVAVMTKVSYGYTDPDAIGQTLDLNLNMTNVDLFLSDHLLLSMIELIFAIQDAYNSHMEDAIGDSDLEETKIEQKYGGPHKGDDDPEETSPEVEYEIVEPEPEKSPVSEDKLQKWKEHINQNIQCKFEGFKITLSERDKETKKNYDIVFLCIQTLKVSVEMANKGMTLVTGVKRFYVQDSYLIRENTEKKSKNPMPEVFAMLVSNPLLERNLLEGKKLKDRETEDLTTVAKKDKIRETMYQLVVKVYNSKSETNIDFLFNNFRVIVNEKTIEKLMKFMFEVVRSLDSQNNQLDKLKQEYLKYYQNETGQEAGPLKSDFKFVDAQEEHSLFESLKKMRENYLIKEKGVKKIKLEKLQEKRRVNFSGNINNIELWVPLEWSNADAKLMSFNFTAGITHYSFTHKDYYINNLTNLIFRVDSITNVDDTKMTLKGLKIKIEHVNPGESGRGDPASAIEKSLKSDIIKSTLLKCSRIEFSFEKEAKPQDNEADSSLVLSIQPIDVNLGFVDINEFKVVYKRIMEIVTTMEEQNRHIIKKLQEDYQEVQQTTENLQQEKRTQNKEYVSKLSKVKQTNTLKVVLSLDCFKLALVDDTGLYHQPLISFDLDAVKTTLEMENGTEDPKSLILRKLGIYEYPYMKGKFSLKAKSYYYNFESGANEPLIEPWSLKANIKKALSDGIDKEGIINIASKQYLNVNLTYGVALVIKKAMDNILSDTISSENVAKEEHKVEADDEEDQVFEISNKLGVEMHLAVEGYQKAVDLKKGDPSVDDSNAIINLPKDGSSVSIKRAKLMELTKKVSKHLTHNVSDFEQFILRMDASVQGMNVVKGIPIELNGVRSYHLEPTAVRSGSQKNFSMIVSVKSRGNGQVFQVAFESPILMANNCDFPIEIG